MFTARCNLNAAHKIFSGEDHVRWSYNFNPHTDNRPEKTRHMEIKRKYIHNRCQEKDTFFLFLFFSSPPSTASALTRQFSKPPSERLCDWSVYEASSSLSELILMYAVHLLPPLFKVSAS